MRMGQRLSHRLGGPTGGFKFTQGLRHTAQPHIACAVVDLLTANMVLVFSQVGQVAEIGKSPNHADCLNAGEGGQFFLQGLASQSVGIASKCHR